MESYGVVYARIPEGGIEALESAVKEARRSSKHTSPLGVLGGEPGTHAFAVVDRWGRSDNMPIWAEGPDLAVAFELLVLSRLVGEVVAVYEIDEGVTMGIYGAWKDGKLVRDLQFMDDRWVQVEGEPQRWEDVLFSQEMLDRALDLGCDETAVRTAFERKQIVADSPFPLPSGITRNLRLILPGPAFGFQPWPPRKELVGALGRSALK